MEKIDFKFDWNDSLKVGIETIDQQHQDLFRIVRKIEQAIIIKCDNLEEEYLLKLLCELREYVTYHFYEEEKIIEDLNLEMLPNHKKHHDEFLGWVQSISCIRLIEEPLSCLEEIRDRLQIWFFQHIISEDKVVFDKIRKN